MIPPRLADPVREQIVERVIALVFPTLPEGKAPVARRIIDTTIDVAFAKLLGDANDRVATLKDAVEAYLDAQRLASSGLAASSPAYEENVRVKRRGLERALELLEVEDAR